MRISIYIQPRASKTEVAGMHDGLIKIRIASPPVDDAANRALVGFIAERLGIAKRQITIIAGRTGRRKVLDIDGMTLAQITAALSS